MYRCVKTVFFFALLMAPASLIGGLTFHGHHDPEFLLRTIGDPMGGVNRVLGTHLPIGGTGLVFLGVNLLLLWTLGLILLLLYSWHRPVRLHQKIAELKEQNREQGQFIDELSAKLEMAWERRAHAVPAGMRPS